MSDAPKDQKGEFPATRWSRVAAAADPSAPEAQRALSDLCGDYWFPLYVYLRRRGSSPEDAEDLTQGFFAKLLDKGYLADADREKGKLRTFLLTALKHYSADEFDKASAQKRGGGHPPPISIDAALAEERYALEPRDDASPDRLFEKRWALTLLDNVLSGLRDDYARKGKAELFEALHPCLAWNGDGDRYSEIAAELGMKEGAVRVAVFRLRRRYGDLLRKEVAETVAASEDVPAELDYLISTLSS